jgi:hypothetical protein
MKSYLKAILIVVLLAFVFVHSEIYKLQGSKAKQGSKRENGSNQRNDSNGSIHVEDHNKTHTERDPAGNHTDSDEAKTKEQQKSSKGDKKSRGKK